VPTDETQEPQETQPPLPQAGFAPPRSILHHPLLYALFLAFYIASHFGSWLPSPTRLTDDDGAAQYTRSFEEMLRDPREVPFASAAAMLAPLLVGSGLLIGYLILRACNIRAFPRCEFPVVPWSAWHLLRCVVVFLVVHRLVAVGVAWVQHFKATRPAWAGVHMSLVAVLAANVIMIFMCLFVAALIAAGKSSPTRLLGLREARPLSRAGLGVTGYLMIFPLQFLAAVLMLVLGPRVGIPPQPQSVLARAVGLSPGIFLILIVSAVVIAPITEEILLRGFLYGTLRRYMGPLAALVLSAGFFALLHGYAFGFLSLFIIGFLLGYLYERTGSLVAPIVAHAANNLYSLLVVYLSFREGML